MFTIKNVYKHIFINIIFEHIDLSIFKNLIFMEIIICIFYFNKIFNKFHTKIKYFFIICKKKI